MRDRQTDKYYRQTDGYRDKLRHIKEGGGEREGRERERERERERDRDRDR